MGGVCCQRCRERDARIAELEGKILELEEKLRDLTDKRKPPQPARGEPKRPPGPDKKLTGRKPGGQPRFPAHHVFCDATLPHAVATAQVRLKLEFFRPRVTTDAGLLAYRELEEAHGPT